MGASSKTTYDTGPNHDLMPFIITAILGMSTLIWLEASPKTDILSFITNKIFFSKKKNITKCLASVNFKDLKWTQVYLNLSMLHVPITMMPLEALRYVLISSTDLQAL